LYPAQADEWVEHGFEPIEVTIGPGPQTLLDHIRLVAHTAPLD
jgi:hypothetical protein